MTQFSQSKVDSLFNKIADFKDYTNNKAREEVYMSDSQRSTLENAIEWLSKTVEEVC